MKARIYNLLVNKHLGIKQRYHKFHDRARGAKKALSWVYLLWLNFAYYVLFCRFLGNVPLLKPYEQKKLLTKSSESQWFSGQFGQDVNSFVNKLKDYEYISFDIFDTLIFRPFSKPTDLFYLIGEKLGFMDFKALRIEAEGEARRQCYMKNGHYEVTLDDIWTVLAEQTGIDKEIGIQAEIELETKLCYANPFMKQVFDRLVEMGKHILIISDMYIPVAVMKRILENSGYTGEKSLYVSCDYGMNKASGTLYEYVKSQLGLSGDVTERWIHVGDNEHSDIHNAKKHGISTCYYPNINNRTAKVRAHDMSPIIGGAYRGVVSDRIYNGLSSYTMEYEYGYIYGGLFVLGYCSFIHGYCKTHAIDKVLFLSRDGDILKQVYDYLYPDDATEYVYWSRRASTKLMFKYNKYDYYRRFIHHKVNNQINISKILEAMELDRLISLLPEELSPNVELTNSNELQLQKFLEANQDIIQEEYRLEEEGARVYFGKLLSGCKKACAVDIGWAGSGAVSISYLVEKAWKLECEVTGIIAGTNTVHNSEPDTSETFLMNGKLVSYLYSQAHNRDLMKRHNPNINYNVYWELLLSSPTKQFKGFRYNGDGQDVELIFGEEDYNKQGIVDIQHGIKDFAKDYTEHFAEFSYMFNISGRDAYAPMLVAASKNEHYLKNIEKRFKLDVNIS